MQNDKRVTTTSHIECFNCGTIQDIDVLLEYSQKEVACTNCGVNLDIQDLITLRNVQRFSFKQKNDRITKKQRQALAIIKKKHGVSYNGNTRTGASCFIATDWTKKERNKVTVIEPTYKRRKMKTVNIKKPFM